MTIELKMTIFVSQIECHQKKEFFTWDDLYGINIDLVPDIHYCTQIPKKTIASDLFLQISLLLDIILFSFLLFMFERGILKRVSTYF